MLEPEGADKWSINLQQTWVYRNNSNYSNHPIIRALPLFQEK